MEYISKKLEDGKAIFLKSFIYSFILKNEDSPYVISNLPRIREGISSTILSAYNVGIANSLSKEHFESALKVVKYITSKETQKKLTSEQKIVSAMSSIYKDEDVCASNKYCDVYQDLQTILKPLDKAENFNNYYIHFTDYFYEFLYGDKDPAEVLKQMNDITKIYQIDISSNETSIGLTIFIIFIATAILMILSLLLLYVNKCSNLFLFLSKSSWFIIMLGIISILSMVFTKIGELSSIKCHMNNILFSMGYTFIHVPILCKLLIHFPEENKISIWIEKNKYKFILILSGVNLILNGLVFKDVYGVETVIVNEGQNYRKCKMEGIYTIIIYIVIIIYDAGLILLLLLLIFIEWNSRKLYMDLRVLIISFYMNLITSTIFFIFIFLNISNYKLNFGLFAVIIYIMALVNYFSLYGIRLLLPILLKKDEVSEIIEKIRVENMSNLNISTSIKASEMSTDSEVISNISKPKSIVLNNNSVSCVSKIMIYHNSSN